MVFLFHTITLNTIDEMHISKKISYNKYKKVHFIDFICHLNGKNGSIV